MNWSPEPYWVWWEGQMAQMKPTPPTPPPDPLLQEMAGMLGRTLAGQASQVHKHKLGGMQRKIRHWRRRR